jgi:putative endonuclease
VRRTGDAFEERACAHLRRAGLRLVERNFHTRFGEIDLIMRDRDTLVFVEVRFRRSNSFGDARASVSASKRQRLIRAAEGFLAAHPELAAMPCRFDIVAFDGTGAAATAHWHRHAFEAL